MGWFVYHPVRTHFVRGNPNPFFYCIVFIDMNLQEQTNRIKEMMGVIKESKSVGQIYHYTRTLDNIISILNTNTLVANIHDQYYRFDIKYLTKTGLNKKKIKDQPVKPHISFTRVKGFNKRTPLLLVFDGNKISNNYGIKPYSMDYQMKNLNKQSGFIGYDESEERVYGDIKNIDRYLEGIEIDFGLYNAINYSNEKLIDNFNKCVEIKNMFPNTNVFGKLKINRNYKPETLNIIKDTFPNVILKELTPPF
jgi:hypothetical protein